MSAQIVTGLWKESEPYFLCYIRSVEASMYGMGKCFTFQIFIFKNSPQMMCYHLMRW